MQYGHFDNARREYVIDRVDLPVSWTNYIGTGDMMGVFNHTAGGYLIYKSPEYHRITRFRPNGVPMDSPATIFICGMRRAEITGASPGSRWARRRSISPAGTAWAT